MTEQKSTKKHDITLYTSTTPNGWKASITLEELGIPYNVEYVQLSKRQQKSASFLKINPNGRIPAIVDHKNGDFPVFESGAIMIYLAEREGKGTLLPKDVKGRSETIQWLMFQMAGVGPMQGQANHFFRYAKEKIPYAIKRYSEETMRLYGVLEKRLTGRKWLAGNQYTIADIANYSWIYCHKWAGLDISKLPNLQDWMKRIGARAAVKKGLDVPEENPMNKLLKDKKLQAKAVASVASMNKEDKQGGDLLGADICTGRG